MSAKHSPGPWRWDGEDSTIEGPNGGAICHVAEHASVHTVRARGEDYSHADARLIAAAPTMRALLERAADAIERAADPGDKYWVEDAAIVDDIRALLARIDGAGGGTAAHPRAPVCKRCGGRMIGTLHPTLCPQCLAGGGT